MLQNSAIRCASWARAILRFPVRRWKLCTILSFIPVALLAVSWLLINWPEAESRAYPGGVILRDASGQIIRVGLGPGDVDCRPFYQADANDWIVKAVIASEDGEFWNHCGVRPLSIVRAAFQNVRFGRRVSGASTLTMQAVRLIRPHPKSLWWKFKEAIMALKLERDRDKLWILEQYLNRAPFGSNLVGIEAAANGWFGHGAKSLGLGEAAMLAGMLQKPTRFRPDRGYEQAIKRRDYVLARMRELGMISDEQLEGAKTVRPIVRRAQRPFAHPYYCDFFLADRVRDAERGTFAAGDYTTPLDADIQSAVEGAVATASAGVRHSVAAVVMDVRRGEIVALACSGDYFHGAAGQVNTALARRPAGSTLKPFLAALAMDERMVAPATELPDVPTDYPGYHPANFDNTYRGRVSLRDSLILSLNIPFVRLLKEVGVERFGEHLFKLGFKSVTPPYERFGLGMAIGNVEVTLVELVRAYGVLASGGGRIYSAAAAYETAEMLSGRERSQAALGHCADVCLPRFAWKTGTSSGYRDAWTVLWNPDYVVGVWCGHLSGRFGDESIVGAKAAAPLAWTIARSLCDGGVGNWYAPPKERIEPIAEFRERGAKAERLVFVTPDDGQQFVLVNGLSQERLAARIRGRREGEELWWFVDGVPRGKSAADEITIDMTAGKHTITCAAADGESATVSFSVSD